MATVSGTISSTPTNRPIPVEDAAKPGQGHMANDMLSAIDRKRQELTKDLAELPATIRRNPLPFALSGTGLVVAVGTGVGLYFLLRPRPTPAQRVLRFFRDHF